MTRLILAAAAALTIGLSAPAAATGKMTCDAPQKSWKSLPTLEAKLKKDGWQVRKSKVDGGCYESMGPIRRAAASRPTSTPSASNCCSARGAGKCCTAPSSIEG